MIGGMAGFHQFVHVGELAMVGAMSRVDRDVPPFMLVEGSPPKVRSLNLVGIRRAGVTGLDDGGVYRALKQAHRILFRSGGGVKEENLRELDSLLHYEMVRHLYRFVKDSTQDVRRRGLIPGKSA